MSFYKIISTINKFRNLFKRNQNQSDLDKEILKSANKDYLNKDYELAIEHANSLINSNIKNSIRIGYKIIGLANYQLNRIQESRKSFEKFNDIKEDSESKYCLLLFYLEKER